MHRVVVEGGLPKGSTPEKPEGDDYSDVPPEEPGWASPPAPSRKQGLWGMPPPDEEKPK